MERTLRLLPGLVEGLLREALDPDIVEVAQGKVEDAEFLATCLRVVQIGDLSERPLAGSILFSPSQALVVGVVDRTADLEDAAKALVGARMGFGGSSPYAPDVVLVNEFVKKDFLNAVVRHSIRFLTEENGVVGQSKEKRGRLPQKQEPYTSEDGIRVVTSGSNGAILAVEDRYVGLSNGFGMLDQ